jgi:hypothetical protein
MLSGSHFSVMTHTAQNYVALFAAMCTLPLNGTTVHNPCLTTLLGEITTTGRFFTISGATIPVKSQIKIIPALG